MPGLGGLAIGVPTLRRHQASVGALVEFDGIVEDTHHIPGRAFSQNPASATKKNPKQCTRLGFLSGCLN